MEVCIIDQMEGGLYLLLWLLLTPMRCRRNNSVHTICPQITSPPFNFLITENQNRESCSRTLNGEKNYGLKHVVNDKKMAITFFVFFSLLMW
jgi:hypothetical protein